jgi:hypothetical protein
MAKSPHYLSSLISYIHSMCLTVSLVGARQVTRICNVFTFLEEKKKILTRCFTAFFMAAVTDNLLWCLKYTYVTGIRYHEIWVHCGTMLYIRWWFFCNLSDENWKFTLQLYKNLNMIYVDIFLKIKIMKGVAIYLGNIVTV